MADPFSLIARCYDRFARLPDVAALRRLLMLPPGGRLLDLGGGTGRIGREMGSAQVIVCDPAAGMAWQSRLKGLLTCRGVAERLPFADGAFDGVLVVDAFHHFHDQVSAVREMLRVLRPSGRLLIVEPDIRSPGMPFLSWGERLLGLSSRMLPPQELGALIVASGGRVLAVESRPFSYRLAATRDGSIAR